MHRLDAVAGLLETLDGLGGDIRCRARVADHDDVVRSRARVCWAGLIEIYFYGSAQERLAVDHEDGESEDEALNKSQDVAL